MKTVKIIKKSRIIYFFIGGFLIFFFEWLLAIFLTEFFLIPVRLSYFLALALGLSLLYFFHKKITFRIKKKFNLKRYQKFILTYTLSYFFNWFFVSILIIKINYIIAIPLVAFCLGIINYLVNRYWVFKIKEPIFKY